jgi:hypothetical protein
MYLNFKYQYHNFAAKLDEECASYYSKQSMSLEEAVTYDNSNLISKLHYRMYLSTLSKVISTKNGVHFCQNSETACLFS